MVDEKRGSDLDVFEGLEKKSTSTRPPSRGQSTPPPPAAGPSMGRPANKRTLLGVAAPLPPPPPSARSVRVGPPSGSSRAPPPLPGRSNLPPVVAPASRASTTAPPPPAAARAGVPVSWDDDDEATHIFEESGHKPQPRTNPTPAAGGRPPHGGTLLGLPNPLGNVAPAPPSGAPATMRPPPPPPSPAAMLARSSGYPAAGHAGGLPPPPMTRPGLGSGFPGGGVTPSPSSIRAPGVPRGMPPLPDPSGTLLVPHPRALDQTALVRPPKKRTALWVFLGLVVVALGGVGIVLLGEPGQGRILVYVTDSAGAPLSHADILVDGTKRCDSAPCTVDAVPGGSHEIKVAAQGFAPPAATTVTVESHKDTSANFSLQATTGGLKVDGHQPGVKLYIDDKEIGPLPQGVRDLSPGDHTIKLAGSDRYQPLERHVTVTASQTLDLGSLMLKVLRGKVTVNPGTPGARVYLVSGTDRRELPSLPISVDIDTTKTWSLEASKSGLSDFKEVIGFDDGVAEKSFVVTLAPKEAPAAPAPVAAAPAPAPAPVRQAPAPAPASAPAPAPAPAVAEGEAFLNINSIPPSTCFLDGHSLGTTPRVHVSVKPGTHVVKFINADQGLSKTVSVSVGAGETKPAVAKLN
jgi:hypothetical protein